MLSKLSTRMISAVLTGKQYIKLCIRSAAGGAKLTPGKKAQFEGFNDALKHTVHQARRGKSRMTQGGTTVVIEYCTMSEKYHWPWVDEEIIQSQRDGTHDSKANATDTQCSQTNEDGPVPVIYGERPHNENTCKLSVRRRVLSRKALTD